MNNETTQKKDTNMKTSRIPAMFRPSSLALAAIAASPKVRQMLNERKASTAIAIAALPAMTCPKCADVRTTEVSRQAKGAEVLTGVTKVTTRHTCAGCEVKWTVVGEGKGKHSVATHKCTADVPNNLVYCVPKYPPDSTAQPESVKPSGFFHSRRHNRKRYDLGRPLSFDLHPNLFRRCWRDGKPPFGALLGH